MKPAPIYKCPRCKSKRISDRVDGGRNCRRCGQRWKGAHLEQSADRREKDGEKVIAQYVFPIFSLFRR